MHERDFEVPFVVDLALPEKQSQQNYPQDGAELTARALDGLPNELPADERE
jgi:hypothetical protein